MEPPADTPPQLEASHSAIATTAAQGDLCPMIEAKITEDSRDSLRTQFVLREVAGGFRISLQDESGCFRSSNPRNVGTRQHQRVRLRVRMNQSRRHLPRCEQRLLSSSPS